MLAIMTLIPTWAVSVAWIVPAFQAQAPPLNLVPQIMAIAGLTGTAYAFGRWRERMHNTEHNVVAEIGRHRAELTQSIARLESRLGSIETHMASATEQRVLLERRLSRVEATLETIDSRLSRMERQLESRIELEAREAA
jgi:septal ring factor EnvC (AmiA/AmiB activator)